jgi:hypothetical protein
MRANISNELINAINDRIYLDLMLHVINNKLVKAIQRDNKGFQNHLDKVYKDVKDQQMQVTKYLKENGVKIYEVVKDSDGEFVSYPYIVKSSTGGFKEGEMRYWRAAIRLELKNRMSKYFGGD